MDKENVIKSQDMWKEYPNTKYWIDTISNPSSHISIGNGTITVDSDYRKAVESLSYILLGKEYITIK